MTNSERRVQRMRKALDPPGQARDDHWIISELARRLGHDWGQPTLEQVWDEQADPFTNTVAVTIGRLRRKLGDPPVIETLAGEGYRIS